MDKRMESIRRQIERIKRELADLGDLRPGSLSKQYNVCGNPQCRCKATPPRKHGPYYQLSFARNGKSSTRFVKPAERPAVQAQIKNYARLRRLVDRWIDLSVELCELQRAHRRESACAEPQATSTTRFKRL